MLGKMFYGYVWEVYVFFDFKVGAFSFPLRMWKMKRLNTAGQPLKTGTSLGSLQSSNHLPFINQSWLAGKSSIKWPLINRRIITFRDFHGFSIAMFDYRRIGLSQERGV
jgi:hypothetical protein